MPPKSCVLFVGASNDFSFHFSDFRSRSYEECILCGRVVEEHVGSQLDP